MLLDAPSPALNDTPWLDSVTSSGRVEMTLSDPSNTERKLLTARNRCDSLFFEGCFNQEIVILVFLDSFFEI